MVDEDILRLKRGYELEIDALNVRILELDRELRGSVARETELEGKLGEVLAELERTAKDLGKERDSVRGLNGDVEGLKEGLRSADAEAGRLASQNHAMEEEILILLRIEADKTKEILLLNENEKMMGNKILSLEVTLMEIQKVLTITTENLKSKEAEGLDLRYLI